VPHGRCGRFALILPVDVALQRDPTITDRHLDRVARHADAVFERAHCRTGDVLIGTFAATRQMHLQIVGYCLDARDAFGGALSVIAITVAIHVA
jgi:hypothetical protein